jgi:hypothetical protein
MTCQPFVVETVMITAGRRACKEGQEMKKGDMIRVSLFGKPLDWLSPVFKGNAIMAV